MKPVLDRDTAYEMIVEMIIGGRVAPNQALSERTLAEIIGIGRTPVREAIRDMARDGLVEVVPLRGTFVRGVDLTELAELYEVRTALESLAAYLAAQNRGSTELEGFRPVFERVKKQPRDIDWHEAQNVGADFHLAIFAATGNRLLQETYKPIRMRFRIPLGLSLGYDHDWILRSVDEHLILLDHIMSGRASEAQSFISGHLHRAYLSKKRILEKISRDDAPVPTSAPPKFRD